MIQIPLWVYYAVMAAGSAAQYKGQEKINSERAKAMLEERLRREKLTRQNEESAANSKNLFADAQAREDKRAGEINQQIAPTATPITTGAAGETRLLDPTSPPSATSTVATARDTFSRANNEVAAASRAKAAASSFGSVFGDYGRALGRNAQDLDINATSMRNWNQNVLPARLEYANESGRDWNTTGDILKLVGTVMAPWALGGGAGGAAAGEGANTTAGVMDQMKGIPKMFAGRDLFGMGQMGMGGLGSAAAGGAGIVADQRLQELKALQQLGHRLSLDDLQYIKEHDNPYLLH